MNISAGETGGAGNDGLKTEGYFKMQIGEFLDLVVIYGQDPPIDQESLPALIESLSARVELKQKEDRSPLPLGRLTVSKLARWFVENQLADTAH